MKRGEVKYMVIGSAGPDCNIDDGYRIKQFDSQPELQVYLSTLETLDDLIVVEAHRLNPRIERKVTFA
jgi:hypothetical protein